MVGASTGRPWRVPSSNICKPKPNRQGYSDAAEWISNGPQTKTKRDQRQGRPVHYAQRLHKRSMPPNYYSTTNGSYVQPGILIESHNRNPFIFNKHCLGYTNRWFVNSVHAKAKADSAQVIHNKSESVIHFTLLFQRTMRFKWSLSRRRPNGFQVITRSLIIKLKAMVAATAREKAT